MSSRWTSASRNRPGDLSLLAAHFAERYARENDRHVPELVPSFFAALARHPWAGNIRELENVIQRCVVLSQGRRLGQKDLRWLLPTEAFEGLPEDPPESIVIEAWTPPTVPVSRRESSAPTGAVVADPRKPLVGVPMGTPVVLPLGLSLPELERFWLLRPDDRSQGANWHRFIPGNSLAGRDSSVSVGWMKENSASSLPGCRMYILGVKEWERHHRICCRVQAWSMGISRSRLALDCLSKI